MNPPPSSQPPLAISLVEYVDKVCDQFEAAWPAKGSDGARPRIEDYLGDLAEPGRSKLVQELLRLELAYRRDAGEKPRLDEYQQRFPQHQQLVLALFRPQQKSGPPGSAAGSAPSSATKNGDWYFAQGKRKKGPVSWDRLRRLAAAGHLQPSDMVIQEGTNKWVPTSSVPDLFPKTPVPIEALTVRPTKAGPSAHPTGQAVSGSFSAIQKQETTSGAMKKDAFPEVPGFQIMGVLGKGGMGIVYKARQTKLNRLVALKMILSGELAGEQELARFRLEAEAVARLQHPHIVQIHEIGEASTGPYFSLEYVEGGSLDKKINGTPLPARQAAQLVRTLARAMHAAHEQSIVHRDLKPQNVLLTAAGKPKITDFGLAKKLDGAKGQTQSGAIVGTPSYMAPEQAGGKKDIGPAADIYALGAILYELLTGRPPFKAETPLDTVLQVLSEEPVAPIKLNPKVPRDLETICLKCLQKDPGKRYASAEELAEDIQRFVEGRPIRARPVGGVERMWRWCRRNPVLSGLSATATMLLILAGVMTSISYFKAKDVERLTGVNKQKAGEAEKEKLRAENALWINQAGRAWQQNREGNVTSVAISSDGRWIVSGDSDGTVKVWDTGTAQGKLSLKGHSSSRHTSVAISSDDRRIVSGGRNGTVKVWDAATGQVQLTLRGQTGDITSVALSGDGRRIVSGSTAYWDGNAKVEHPGTVKVWDAATGKEKLTLRGHTGNVTSVAISGDGRRIVSGSNSDRNPRVEHPGTVKVWDAATGKEQLTLTTGHVLLGYSVAISGDGRRIVSGSEFRPPKVWDAATGQELRTLTGHTFGVESVAISRDGRRIVTGGVDKTVKVWDAATGQALRTLTGHTWNVRSVAISSDGRWIVSASTDGIRFWDAASGQK
jgi:serine/threonine protein kinase